MKEFIFPLIILIIVIGLYYGLITLFNKPLEKKCASYGSMYELKKGLYDTGYCSNKDTGEIKGL